MVAGIPPAIMKHFSEVNGLAKNVKKVFGNCPSRVTTWTSFDYKDRPKFPPPVITRWGTWLNAVVLYANTGKI